MPEPVVAALHRFPVKGLSPEALDAARLVAGAYFPGDRLFAVERGPCGFDEDRPVHLDKTRFLMLQRDAALARLRTAYDPVRRRLSIRDGAELLCDASVDEAGGRAAIAGALGAVAGRGVTAPRLLHARAGFSFTDCATGYVSLLNLASVRAVAEAVGRPVDPLRFRANLAMEGLEPWAENEWVGRRLRIGEAVLEVVGVTERCAATGVDPATGARDMNVVKTLVHDFGHTVCGVYARVVADGTVRAGDTLALRAAA